LFNKSFFNNRFNILCILFFSLLFILGFKMAALTIIEGENYRKIADIKNIKDIPVKAPRGKILDRNGKILADNVSSYTVQIYADQVKDDEINDVAYTLSKILDENAENPVDEFPILLDTFEFINSDLQESNNSNENNVNLDTSNTTQEIVIELVRENIYEWLNYQAVIYGENFNPKDRVLKTIKKDIKDLPIELVKGQYVFSEEKNNIETNSIKTWFEKNKMNVNLGPDEVISELLINKNKYILNIFSNSKTRRFSYDYLNYRGLANNIKLVKYSFVQNYDNSLNESSEENEAVEAFNKLRETLKIDSKINDYDLRNMLVIRERYNKTNYLSYHPMDISYDVSEKTVAMISERSNELIGVNVEIEPIRYYPENDSAAHILGYLGKISQDYEINEYIKENGYSPDDIIGKTGVEEKFEEYLSGEKGKKTVEVNNMGKTIRSISNQAPKPGDDLYLTIDLKLQKKSEESLKNGLEQIQKGGVFESEWGDFKFGDSYKNAKSGSIVALDVKTGEVLALANYPSYDLNLFSTGISTEDWNSLLNDSKDPLAPKPLYNTALLTSIQPGSTFKMVTALAALEKGVDPLTEIYCPGTIKVGERNFNCWSYTLYGRGHGWQNMYEAIQNSCNVYFYVTSLGENPVTNQKHTVKVDENDIIEVAKKLGLDSKTEIEIDIPKELSGGVPNIESKKLNNKINLILFLKENIEKFLENDYIIDENKKNEIIEEIVSWIDKKDLMTRTEAYNSLKSLGLNPEKTNSNNIPLVDIIKYTYINQSNWSSGDKLNMAIGQGYNSFTTIQMARYVETIANGGYLRNASVVKSIKTYDDKETDYKPLRESERIDITDYNYLEIIKEGMKRVSEFDSASPYANFPVEVGSKTGTAQKDGINPETGKPYDEFSWYVAFAPYDDPQIAVAVVLFQGGSGRYPTPIARDVIGEYLKINETIPNIKN